MNFMKKCIVLVTFAVGVLYPSQVWSQDSVGSCVQEKFKKLVKERIFEITIDMVACTDPVASFDRIACDAANYSKTYQEFQCWIDKCHKYDPKHRSKILDYYKTIECESNDFKMRMLVSKNPLPSYNTPLASFSLWENKGFDSIINLFEKLRKSYWIEDKKNHDKNYTNVRAFAKVLRQPDANGLSFLDHVVLNWSDEDVERIGLGADNLRNGLIRQMCGIGVTFAKKENREKYPCKSNPKFAGF